MKKVTAYCRVSTDHDDQLNSLENQKKYFEDFINKNDDWEFVGLYVDEGISGTSVKKRTGFKQMILDAEKGKFDLVITKEISRFARNTLDSIFYTRKLKALDVGVIFSNDNINTLDPDSELRLTIMASIAQEESRKISERVKWGQKRSMENGFVYGTNILGYTLKDGKLYINEAEAEIIKNIFDLYYVKGYGSHSIAKQLENMGVPSPSGLNKWSNVSVLNIIKNEKYAGILKQRKTVTTDYLAHSRKKNNGREDFITIENNHAPIISKELFEAVQREVARRQGCILDNSKYSNKYVWSGKIQCGICGANLKRRIWHANAKYEKIVWECATRHKYGKEKSNSLGEKIGCDLKPMHELIFQQSFTSIIKDLVKDKNLVIRNLEEVILKTLEDANNKEAIRDINLQISTQNKRKDKLFDLYTDETINKQDFKQKNDKFNKQLDSLYSKLEQMKLISEDFKEKQEIINKIKTIIENLSQVENFDEYICRELLNKVIVYSKNHIKFILNGNIEKDFLINDESSESDISTKSNKKVTGSSPINPLPPVLKQDQLSNSLS